MPNVRKHTEFDSYRNEHAFRGGGGVTEHDYEKVTLMTAGEDLKELKVIDNILNETCYEKRNGVEFNI